MKIVHRVIILINLPDTPHSVWYHSEISKDCLHEIYIMYRKGSHKILDFPDKRTSDKNHCTIGYNTVTLQKIQKLNLRKAH